MEPSEQLLHIFNDAHFWRDVRLQRAERNVIMTASYSLTLTDAQRLAPALWQVAIQESKRLDLLSWLNALHPGSLTAIMADLLDQHILYPPWLFIGAQSFVRDRLLASVNHGESMQPQDHLLQALVWIGDQTVQRQLLIWEAAPPPWKDALYLTPAQYSLVAGWEMQHGQRRDLFWPISYPLSPNEALPDEATTVVIGVDTPLDEKCPWCGRILAVLFDIDLRNSLFAQWLGSGERLRIPYCHWCSCYTPIFMNVTLLGEAHWSAANGDKPSILRQIADMGDPLPAISEKRYVQMQRPSPFEAVSQFGDWIIRSQLGGHPTWIQDFAYPTCPNCGTLMPYIGQIAWEELDAAFLEGITTAYLCLPCGISATTYDQT